MMREASLGTVPVLLSPRPLARCPGAFPLIPLLLPHPSPKSLPLDVWSTVLAHILRILEAEHNTYNESRKTLEWKLGLLLVCKDWKAIASPLFYAHVCIATMSALEKLAHCLQSAEQKWDSLRRIPYSTPGRWIRTFDLSSLSVNTEPESYYADALLTILFPLLPFMSRCDMTPSLSLSGRAIGSLTYRDGAANLHSLRGIKKSFSSTSDEQPLIELLHNCVNLEELEIVGTGLDMVESWLEHAQEHNLDGPRLLPLIRLRKLVLLSIPCSNLMYLLLRSPLPALRHLTVTPYDDSVIPASLIPQFIEVHGQSLTSLHLFTLNTWPTIMFPSPTTILTVCPNLYHLSLEKPLPVLVPTREPHPLKILSVPRPDAQFFPVLNALLPKLPGLKLIHARDVRWLRGGVSPYARTAGVQGDMMVWKRRLSRRGIDVVDAEWKSWQE
ncbi:hypothetical protein CERSUDRAFT_147248 [Gelatoporia subvermispora B]|uniref:F-box domain-containing protein n=1 Tax=Ceriporiopsis subvermispora (strain B) TaxID=914234 RepID=M2RTT9_CERS8|nr:hypothetical protein CERSUDRAFT_147248 [Gelatoporia subvermispora B]